MQHMLLMISGEAPGVGDPGACVSRGPSRIVASAAGAPPWPGEGDVKAGWGPAGRVLAGASR